MSPSPLPVLFPDVVAAQHNLVDAIVRTPTVFSQTLSELTGATVFLKFENLQFTAAYKERGALNRLLSLDDASRKTGVIAASAGNHAQGLAYHGRRLGIPVTIVMPSSTPLVKITVTESHGATVVLHGESFDDAFAHAKLLEASMGLTFVHPFDDPVVIAGQGTVALELLADAPDLDVVVVPIGGGGLISGVSIVVNELRPQAEVIGVQAELFPSMFNLVADAQLPVGGDTIAEGIAVAKPGQITRQIVRALVKDILLVNERDIELAIALLAQIEKTVVEGAGAAGLAALLADPKRFAGKRVGLILCGGNIDTRLLANVLTRALVHAGSLSRIRIPLPDRPGVMAKLTSVFHHERVNIVEIAHQRVYSSLPAKVLVVQVECETRNAAHRDQLVAALQAAGYDASLVTD
jgi:threonine dehydratase